MRAVRIHGHGGPEVLRYEEVELAPPAPGEVRVRHIAIAVNYSDVNLRRGGFYLSAPLRFPLIPGNEAAGVIVESDDKDWTVGERIAYVGAGGPFYEDTGAYAEERNLPARALLRLPDAIPERTAAALMLKGLTASMLIHRCHRPQAGEAVLIHGAAGGVALLLAQWAKHLGATVIGTVGSEEKARLARAHGCDHAILHRETDFVAAVRKLAPQGVHAVYDGVGRDTFLPSLEVLRRFGALINYGNASGHPEPLDLLRLAKKGSLRLMRPAFSDHIAERGDFEHYAQELFDLVGSGVLQVAVGKSYRLQDAAEAHRDLEARRAMGPLVLLP